MDNQVLAAYNKMLEKEQENAQPVVAVAPPAEGKQSIFSPARAKLVQTPIKKATPYKTPSKTELENQKSASRKAYRSAAKEGAIVKQLLSADKRDILTSQDTILEAYPENKELAEEVKRLTGVINEKQRLIVGITQKLGEFVGKFRGVRRTLDQLKAEVEVADAYAGLEKFRSFFCETPPLSTETNTKNHSPIITMQTDVETWHKNLLSDEGTGINVYEVLKRVSELVYKDRKEALDYYQNLVNRRLTSERETYEVLLFRGLETWKRNKNHESGSNEYAQAKN